MPSIFKQHNPGKRGDSTYNITLGHHKPDMTVDGYQVWSIVDVPASLYYLSGEKGVKRHNIHSLNLLTS